MNKLSKIFCLHLYWNRYWFAENVSVEYNFKKEVIKKVCLRCDKEWHYKYK